jgi:hypothetical protein
MKLFLSYSRRDEAFVQMLRGTLASWGHQLWMDKTDIPLGAAWPDEIQKGLEWADAVLGVMTRNALASDNVKNEWDWSLVYRGRLGKALYLLKIDDAVVPMRYVRLNWIDFHEAGQENGLQMLHDGLAQTPQHPAVVPIAADDVHAYLETLYRELIEELEARMLSAAHRFSLLGRETPDRVQEIQRRETPRILRAFSIRRSPAAAAEPALHDFESSVRLFSGRLLLLGEPGAGKTVAVLSAARDAVVERIQDPAKPLPLIGRVATWNSRQRTPLSAWLASSSTLPAALVEGEIAAGRTLLLLDGLDELGSTASEDMTTASGESKLGPAYDPRARFLDLLPSNNHILLTCRSRDYEEIGSRANLNGAITLQPLDDQQINEFLSGVPGVALLWNTLRDQPDLLMAARTPLLLSFLTVAYRDTPEQTRALAHLDAGELRDAIFSQFIERSYEHAAQRYYVTGAEAPFTLDYIRAVLGLVAMRNAGSTRVRYAAWAEADSRTIVDNVIDWRDFAGPLGYGSSADENRSRIDEFVGFCAELQVLVKGHSGTFRFAHLLLRDHLVFQYCVPRLRQVDQYSGAASNGFYGLDTNPATALARTDSRAVSLLAEMLPTLDVDGQQWKERQVRDNALLALSEIHQDAAVDVLIDWLTHHLTDWPAAVALGHTGARRAKDVLIEAIKAANPWAVDALVTFGGDPQAVESVVPLLRSKQAYAREERTRWTAERLLHESVQHEHVPLLVSLLSDEHPFVRAAAAQSLGKLRAPETLQALQALCADDADINGDLSPSVSGGPTVRQIAEMAISKLLTQTADQ